MISLAARKSSRGEPGAEAIRHGQWRWGRLSDQRGSGSVVASLELSATEFGQIDMSQTGPVLGSVS